MSPFRKSMAVVLTGVLVIAVAVALPLLGRCLAKVVRGETLCFMRLSSRAQRINTLIFQLKHPIMDFDGKVLH